MMKSHYLYYQEEGFFPFRQFSRIVSWDSCRSAVLQAGQGQGLKPHHLPLCWALVSPREALRAFLRPVSHDVLCKGACGIQRTAFQDWLSHLY